MRHYVAYHNVDRMGPQRDMFRIYTSKSVKDLPGETVWVIAGGGSPKRYRLNSEFTVSDVGDCDLPEFKYFARGDGHAFDPPVELTDLEWFAELRKKLANFSVGLQQVSEQDLVDQLLALVNR